MSEFVQCLWPRQHWNIITQQLWAQPPHETSRGPRAPAAGLPPPAPEAAAAAAAAVPLHAAGNAKGRSVGRADMILMQCGLCFCTPQWAVGKGEGGRRGRVRGGTAAVPMAATARQYRGRNPPRSSCILLFCSLKSFILRCLIFCAAAPQRVRAAGGLSAGPPRARKSLLHALLAAQGHPKTMRALLLAAFCLLALLPAHAGAQFCAAVRSCRPCRPVCMTGRHWV